MLRSIALAGTAPPPDELRQYSEANLAFACDLYAQLKSAPGNLVVSPHGVFTILTMAYAGAHGETEREIARVLHLRGEPRAVHPIMATVTKKLQPRVWIGAESKQETSVLELANGIWGQAGIKVVPDFQQVMREHYGASLRSVDFANQPRAACDDINAWVKEHTRGRFQNVVQPEGLDPRTRLMLVSASYFRGNWLLPFIPALTQDEYFTVPSAPKQKVPMMYQQHSFAYYECTGLQLLRMGYLGTSLSMVVLLPPTSSNLSALESKLSPANIIQWNEKAVVTDVKVYLPRFKIAAGLDLKPKLENMGLTACFSFQTADFSGMMTDKPVFIEKINQAAVIEVNEKGTEASAVTDLPISVGLEERPPPLFRADRPFLFLIYDHQTKTILFMGRVVDPTK